MQDYRYASREQCVVGSTFCRTINALVKISVSLALLFCRATSKNSLEQRISSLTPFLV